MVVMKKIFICLLLLGSCAAYADYNYISPESYAVNESDMTDYMQIPATPRPSLDSLLYQEDYSTVPAQSEVTIKEFPSDKKKVKNSKQSNLEVKPFEKKLSYKIAKWWVDKRYEREEEHHGNKHEIKVKARMEYENQQNSLNEAN